MKKIFSMMLVLLMLFTLTACAGKEGSTAKEPVPFKVVVTDLEGNETVFEYTSSAASVGEALLAEGLIQGEKSSYGLFVNTVNGITADWDADQTFWAFYIDGVSATTYVDNTEIVANTTYGFTLTKG